MTKIELVGAADVGHPAHPEMWLRVLSDEILDLGQIRRRMTPEQRTTLADYYEAPCAYYPNLSEPDEREGYAFEDWWAFPMHGWTARSSAHEG